MLAVEVDGSVHVGSASAFDERTIEGASTPAIATSQTRIAVAFVTADSHPRVTFMDRDFAIERSIDLGGSFYRGAMKILWNERRQEWAIAWTEAHQLTEKERDDMTRAGSMLPSFGTIPRVRLARLEADGALASDRALEDGELLDLAIVDDAYVALRLDRRLDELPCGPSVTAAVEYVGLTIVQATSISRGLGEHAFVACSLDEKLGRLLPAADGFVAIVQGCDRLDRDRPFEYDAVNDGRQAAEDNRGQGHLLGLRFSKRGKPAGQPIILADNAFLPFRFSFDAFSDGTRSWLVFIEDSQWVLESLSAALEPEAAYRVGASSETLLAVTLAAGEHGLEAFAFDAHHPAVLDLSVPSTLSEVPTRSVQPVGACD